MQKKLDTQAVPFRGGQNTYLEPALIGAGSYSAVQNFRQMHPGLKKRPGQVKTHWSADSTNRVMSLYQFSEGKTTERHLYAQMSDGDVLESYAAPPIIGEELLTLDVAPATVWADGVTVTGVTSTKTCVIVKNLTTLTYIVKDRSGTFTLSEVMGTGTNGADNQANQGAANPTFANAVFGAQVFAGADNSIPASWANFDDFLLYCNGVNYPQIYPGTGKCVDRFLVFSGGSDPTNSANVFSGTDYSTEVSDGDTTTYADLSNLQVITLIEGPELVTNGTFASEASWTHSDASITGGVLNFADNISPGAWSHQTIAAQQGMQYTCTFDYVKAGVPLWVKIYLGTSAAMTKLIYTITTEDSGAKSFSFVSPLTNPDIWFWVHSGVGTHATIDNLTIKASGYSCVFIKTAVPADTFNFTVPSGSENTAAAVAAIKYWNGAWTNATTGFADTTIATAGKSFGQSGTISFTQQTDELATYIYGQQGYWYILYLSSGYLDAQTRVSAATYETDWQSIANVWDGTWVDAIEALFYDATAGTYSTFSAEAVTIDAMTASDIIYLSSFDDIENINITILTASTTASGTVKVWRWDGANWIDTSATDNTTGFTLPGRLVFTRGASKAQEFHNTGYLAHWYKLTVDVTLSAAVDIGIQVQPYFDIAEFGKGMTCCAWKDRMVYTFDRYPSYIYITAAGNPQTLNGDDYDAKQAGDGRSNKVSCMKQFYNELMVFQEEKGVEGGCVTLFDGYDPDTFGRLILSSKYGTMNSQSVAIIEGFDFGGEGKEFGLAAFFLSRSGVLFTDGKSVRHVPNMEKVRNYFDPTNATSIRSGYESQMWLKYDSAFNILRIGLVTGSDTTCKTFLTYDLTDFSWGGDVYTQELASFTEVEAASGTAPVLQIGGGTDDGFVYLLNSGLNDVSTAIDAFVTPEYDTGGDIIHIDEIMLRAKVQSAGNITVTPSLNSIAQTAFTLAQTAETANQTIRRHKKSLDLTGQHISLKIQHNTASESCYLEDMKLKFREFTER